MLFTNQLDSDIVFNGSSRIILDFTNNTQAWSKAYYRKSLENFWIPEKVSLDSDVLSWKTLSTKERDVFKALLGYAIALDSLQSKHIGNLQSWIKHPLVNALLAVQQSMETLHSASYSYISESLLSDVDKVGMYRYWETDPLLRARCLTTSQSYQTLYDCNSDIACFIDALITNYVLESIQFQLTFRFFELLESQHKLMGCASILALIKRDEDIHIATFQKLLLIFAQELPTYFSGDQIITKIQDAISFEKQFASHLLDDQIIGLESNITNQYFDWLANDRLKALKLNSETIVKNPLSYLSASSDYAGESVKANFFESSVVAYAQSNSLSGWDF
jgi:ribonucleoside-diphosphate reductase beta chain